MAPTLFRVRHYRRFVVIALVCVLAIYQLSHVQQWQIDDVPVLKKYGLGGDNSRDLPQAPVIPGKSTTIPIVADKARLYSAPAILTPSALPTTSSIPTQIPATPTSVLGEPLAKGEDALPLVETDAGHQPYQNAQKKTQDPAPVEIYWQPQEEHFAIPTESLKQLPTSSPKVLNKVQFEFAQETAAEQAERLQRLEAVKESFKHAWDGYATWAMPHDELKPFSKEVKDPFNGWGATMVDALDSLWIMGMTTEFEEAVDHVSRINFKTSVRKDIPVFETVIRYLGGLVSAFDLTSGKYPVLLDKAVELAEILMGAFDTPNRMPVTYYRWAPSSASQPHRAGTHIVLAELGSLLVEFTRLAQLTKEAKFYDAVARITDALESWQMNTTMPGLWPIKIDASGCKKLQRPSVPKSSGPPVVDPSTLTWVEVGEDVHMQLAPPVQIGDLDPSAARGAVSPPEHAKRQLDDAPGSTNGGSDSAPKTPSPLNAPVPFKTGVTSATGQSPSKNDCEVQSLAPEPLSTWHSYSIGAMADSTYEYLPKQYLLLGGLNDQYRSMYQNAVDAIRRNLLYRPMTVDNQDILFVGRAKVIEDGSMDAQMTYEGSHLGCFAGGMFALGSRVFDIASDMDIARRLTDGCVWAYDSTATGIMPEEFQLLPCPGGGTQQCVWNQTRYYEVLDPQQHIRVKAADDWNEKQKSIMDANKAKQSAVAQPQQGVSAETPDAPDAINVEGNRKYKTKRQLVYHEQASHANDRELHEQPSKTTVKPIEAADTVPSRASSSASGISIHPKKVLSHEEYVEAKIKDDRLPSSFTSIRSREYKLRPEAVESIFIMYRLTGDRSWMDKGWRMFNAIQMYTRTVEANSAINDVTSMVPKYSDSMESFWLAETLKYFYLLFSDPELISLDDYVLNTEAHPFRIPQPVAHTPPTTAL